MYGRCFDGSGEFELREIGDGRNWIYSVDVLSEAFALLFLMCVCVCVCTYLLFIYTSNILTRSLNSISFCLNLLICTVDSVIKIFMPLVLNKIHQNIDRNRSHDEIATLDQKRSLKQSI